MSGQAAPAVLPVAQRDFKNKKGPTFVGPARIMKHWLRHRPDPDDPGGLGAEESGTERTGPTHEITFRNSARQSVGGSLAAL
jgi:hypothetical protein